MTEQEKLDYYELHGVRPPENYIFYRLCYKTSRVIERSEAKFKTIAEAREHATALTENSADSGRITLLFIDRRKAADETVTEDFEELIEMFWPEAVKEAMQTFFEVL